MHIVPLVDNVRILKIMNNMGGARRLKLISSEHVEFTESGSLYNMTILPGATVISIQHYNVLELECIDESISFDESSHRSRNGVFYIPKVSAIIAQNTSILSRYINDILKGKWVAEIQDNNGYIHVLGNPQSGLKAKAGKTTPSAIAGRNQATIELTSRQIESEKYLGSWV